MATFGDLPIELVENILLWVQKVDQARLARTCRWLNGITIPVLWANERKGRPWLLWISIFKNNMDALKFGLQMGLDPNTDSGLLASSAGCPIHSATKMGNNKAIKLLLDAGADIEATTNTPWCHWGDPGISWTSLHLAICHGDVSTAEMLIDHGASMTVGRVSTRPTGRTLGSDVTALHTAAQKAIWEIVNLILDRGLVSPNNRDMYSRTPLHCAFSRPSASPRPIGHIIARLLEAGADQTLKDRDWHTPFELSCKTQNHEAALALLNSSHSQLRLNRRSINRAFRYAIRPLNFFRTPEEQTYRNRQRKLVGALLELGGISINQRYHDIIEDLTPLHAALRPQYLFNSFRIPDVEVVRLLLAAGARPNSMTRDGKTSLHLVIDIAVDLCAEPTNQPQREALAALANVLLFYGARLDVRGSSPSAQGSPVEYGMRRINNGPGDGNVALILTTMLKHVEKSVR